MCVRVFMVRKPTQALKDWLAQCMRWQHNNCPTEERASGGIKKVEPVCGAMQGNTVDLYHPSRWLFSKASQPLTPPSPCTHRHMLLHLHPHLPASYTVPNRHSQIPSPSPTQARTHAPFEEGALLSQVRYHGIPHSRGVLILDASNHLRKQAHRVGNDLGGVARQDPSNSTAWPRKT
eukprot:1138705-Pelagomonas_calceolata.AAC.4